MKSLVFQKRYKIILMPDDAGRMRQFTLPAVIIPILTLCLVLSGICGSWFILHYHSMKTHLANEAQLQEENTFQMEHLAYLAKRVNRLDRRLREMNNASRESGTEEKGTPSDRSLPGLERIIPTTLQADYPDTKETESMVQWMHLSLDKLDDAVNSIRDARMEQVRKKGTKENNLIIQEMLAAVAVELNLEPRLALSMAKVESGFNTRVVSPKGAIGILQVTPGLAWHHYGITRDMLFHPQTNIRVGLSVMKSLLERFDQNVDLALAAYNAGASRVLRAGNRVPAIRETQAYVKRVKAAMQEF